MTPATAMSPSLQAKAKQAHERLDAHVRDIVQWHFHPETGTPFWLETAKTLQVQPAQGRAGASTTCKKFGLFEDEWLRGGPVRRWVPKALHEQADLRLRDRRHHRHPQEPRRRGRLPHRLRDVQRHAAGQVLPQGIATGSCSARPARAGCGWPSSTCASIAAASASASISIRAGSSSSSRRAGWST